MTFLKSPFVKFLILLILLGQIVFAMGSSWYTAPRYEGRIYATLAVKTTPSSDLHKLNEAAHYFGQTVIGWTKFPNFEKILRNAVPLLADATLRASMQERQNLIFTVRSREPVTQEHMEKTKDFLQSKLQEYNRLSNTGFALSNVDYEALETTRSYGPGAFITALLTLILGGAFLNLRKEFHF